MLISLLALTSFMKRYDSPLLVLHSNSLFIHFKILSSVDQPEALSNTLDFEVLRVRLEVFSDRLQQPVVKKLKNSSDITDKALKC